MKRFLTAWALALVALLALAGGLNVLINPYEVFAWGRIPGLNVYKPGIRNHTAMAKAYQIERARPATVVIGTSRAYLGIDAGSAAWPAPMRPVYNHGTPGTNMSQVLFRELREAWGMGRLKHAVAILDVPAFLSPDPPLSRGPDEKRQLFLDDGTPNPERRVQRLSDAFLATFTLGALADSTATIVGQKRGTNLLDLRPDGTATEADFLDVAQAEGMNALFTQKDLFDLGRAGGFARVLSTWNGPMPNMAMIRDIVAFCREHDIALTLILGSAHIDQMEIYRRAGLWPRIEQMKSDLAAIVADAHSDTITAWDFVEYSPYTTETVPPAGDRKTRMRWFWEPVHFQRALGDAMVSRAFSGTPPDFGAKLTAASVDARNREVRAQQAAFTDWHLACEAKRPRECGPPAGR